MKNWLSIWRGPRRAGFSVAALAAEQPGLASLFLWKENELPGTVPDPLWLHFGCGEHVLDGFLNLDFLPHDARVAPWDLLEPWPERWPRPARGAFSEDTLEHFFLGEQLYILCEVNRALAPGATFRVLMPALDRLLAYCRGFEPRRGEFLYQTFGVETEADAINAGMRFSGHRWLHDAASLGHLARQAGFEALRTTCAESTEPYLSGRNLRVEEGTAAFAHDLRKERSIARRVVAPAAFPGLEPMETLPDGIRVLRVAGKDAELRFALDPVVALESIACVNVRSANLTSFREHSLKRIILRGSFGEGSWALDETLKSRLPMNVVGPPGLRVAAGADRGSVTGLALSPGAEGDLVTAGALELFLREPV